MGTAEDGEHGAAPFDVTRCRDLEPLRRALKAAGFNEESIAKIVLMDASSQRCDIAASIRRTAGPSPLHTLVRLFVQACPVPEARARAVLDPAELDDLVALGLLRRSDGAVRAAAALIPCGGLLIVRDSWPEFSKRPKTPDFVLGVGPATHAIANLTVRRHGEAALDLGTGCGYLALLAARHAARVVATDINPRALSFAALNARLNGLANIEFRQGSLYEPVADERFDLIMCNPPFAITPETRYEYRDDGQLGDRICEQVIRGAPAHLLEGGFATVLFDWHHRGQDDWAERPMQWVRGRGCDAWLLCFDTRDPLTYAAGWLREETVDEQPDAAEQLDAWLAYYERLGIGRMSSGAVVLRRRTDGPNWVHAQRTPSTKGVSSCSSQIQCIFAAHGLLQGLGDDRQLLDLAFVLTPDHRLEHTLQADNGTWVVRSARLTRTRGLPFVGNVDRWVGTILAGCDGHRTLRQLVTDLAGALSVDFERLAPACIGLFRKFLETGFLSVAGRQGAP